MPPSKPSSRVTRRRGAGTPGIRSLAAARGPGEVRVGKSQAALRRRRGIASEGMPGRWLTNPSGEATLSVALGHREASLRSRQVAHPAPGVQVHHLEVRSLEDLDGEIAARLREPYGAAG